ncbi:MAG: hypothetical protein OXP70_08070 [Acidobacteriota bacterium]|nr:hypothetical protein [Acidobacteriota bacterium]
MKRLLLLPWRFSMGNRLTDGEKVVVSVFVAVLAGCVAGLFFVGGAILDMKDAITDVKVSLVEMQRDIGDLQEDVADLREDLDSFRAEVSERFDALEGRMSAVEAAIEAHHGNPPRPAN